MLHQDRQLIEVTPVRGPTDRKAFVRVAREVYREDPGWVRPLDSVVRDHLDQGKNPFYREAQGEAFLVREGGRPVGRIWAAVSRRFMKLHGQGVGCFGLFECAGSPAAATALLAAAESFVRRYGATTIRGPFNIAAAQEMGIVTDGFGKAASIDMAYTPPEYVEMLERSGFSRCLEVATWRNDSVASLNASEMLAGRHRRSQENLGITVRSLDPRHRGRDLEMARELTNAAMLGNWGYVPITREEWQLQIGPIAPLLDPALILFAEVRGVPVGVTLAVPDFAPALRRMNGRMVSLPALTLFRRQKAAIVILFAVRKQFQGQGIGKLMNAELVRALQGRGYGQLSITWIADENAASKAQARQLGARPLHRLAMFEKETG